MRLWTIQTDRAYQSLQSKGVLIGDWRRVDKDFKLPYKWLCEEMEDRGIHLNGRPPIWSWSHKPDLRETGHVGKGERAVRLELEIPAATTLSSNFGAWHCILNDHYLISNDDELNKAFPDVGKVGYTSAQTELSWQRVFDLEFCTKQAEYVDYTQVTFPKIELSYVKRIKAFTGR